MASSPLPFPFPPTTTSYRAGAIFKFEMCQSARRHLVYINDLSKSVSDKSSPILFADDTSFIIANHDKDKFKFNTNEIFNEINKWFCSNLLTLNYDKTYFFAIFN